MSSSFSALGPAYGSGTGSVVGRWGELPYIAGMIFAGVILAMYAASI